MPTNRTRDRVLEAPPDKAYLLRVADITELAGMAKGHLKEGWFEDALACLRLMEEHAAVSDLFELLVKCASDLRPGA